MSDIRLQIRVKNARILRAMEAAGYFTVAELCRAMGGPTQSHIGALINFKLRPYDATGEWSETAMNLATMLHREPEELWPESLKHIEARKSETHMDMTLDQFQSIASHGNAVIDRQYVAKMLDHLPPKERLVIEERYGFGGGESTLDDVGRRLNVSRERVRQIEARAMRKLKHPAVNGVTWKESPK